MTKEEYNEWIQTPEGKRNFDNYKECCRENRESFAKELGLTYLEYCESININIFDQCS